MIKETIRPKFSEIDFIRLFCAINFKNEYSPIIKHHELEGKLYGFKSFPEFRDLFQDIRVKKDPINPENSYLDLGIAINTAQLFGFLTPIYEVGETKSIISCDEEIAQEIIANTDPEMVSKMTNLFGVIFGLDNNSKQESQEPTLVKSKSRK